MSGRKSHDMVSAISNERTLLCTVGMSGWQAEAVALLYRRFPSAAAMRVLF